MAGKGWSCEGRRGGVLKWRMELMVSLREWLENGDVVGDRVFEGLSN